MALYYSACIQGILWSLMGMGLYISFRILGFADLTSEASFTLGAGVAAILIQSGYSPLLATLLAIGAGMLAGLVTGWLTTFLAIPGLLASIITMTGLYSVSLRVMGQPNLSLRGSDTLFSLMEQVVASSDLARLVLGLVFALLVVAMLSLLFKTDLGQALVATGDNRIMADSLGINTHRMLRLALMLSNGLIALSGALVAQDNGFADIQLGNGTVVIAFSAIVIGEVIFRQQLSLTKRLMTVVLGAVIYRLILVAVLQLGFNANDFRFLSAFVLVLFLAGPNLIKRYFRQKGGY
ncbi:branched-chain amino acid ABC transporter permease [Facklamia sp. HMSC062C11]|uniref:ABC transporter permease n=1 Tax=Facklamia sp. HMSC062C11 TaxID=1739262 RepID=UPI0008A3E7FD|nr:branched-chain amino acid ABC transporter permease [Facklamia sp. HMSC062C11]OFL66875.1 branched-chain amino acid ABC transporter permease [Facklamia sp. HMSC062C11]